jgi:DNA-binding transcriptional LysR family regulator
VAERSASKTCFVGGDTRRVSPEGGAPVDLDLRKLRYFVAVAEELNFRRAAESLHVAQPVLSRQIRALETELKAELFVRDHRGAALTAAGAQLLADAGPLLAEADAVQRRLARVSRGQRMFTIAFMPGLTVTDPAQKLRAAHPELTVDVLRTDWEQQVAVLHDGRADVSYLRLPVDTSGLSVRPLFSEARVVVLRADHPLAGRRTLRLAELAQDVLLQDPAAVPEWPIVTGARPAIPPDKRPRTVEEKLEYVAAGHGFVVLPRSAALYYRRQDIAQVRVRDLAPNEVSLAWVASRRSRLITEFAELAAEAAG